MVERRNALSSMSLLLWCALALQLSSQLVLPASAFESTERDATTTVRRCISAQNPPLHPSRDHLASDRQLPQVGSDNRSNRHQLQPVWRPSRQSLGQP